ncbi:MAG: hypothetical protein FJZ96_09220 [Chloroflexi bacterium]|nr:hypothetical protein [Chloroflexota bacterium]
MIEPSAPHAVQTLDDQERQPSLLLGVIAGGIAMLIGAVLWGVITYATEYQVSYMAIGLGALVGVAMHKLGRGGSLTAGIIAALLSLAGCLLGNFFFYTGAISKSEGMPFLDVLFALVIDPSIVMEIFSAAFEIMDLLFYAIAMYVGFSVARK